MVFVIDMLSTIASRYLKVFRRRSENVRLVLLSHDHSTLELLNLWALSRGRSIFLYLSHIKIKQYAVRALSHETYICGQSDITIDYAAAQRRKEPISTAITLSPKPRLIILTGARHDPEV